MGFEGATVGIGGTFNEWANDPTAAPHLEQNFAPESSFAPQFTQKPPVACEAVGGVV